MQRKLKLGIVSLFWMIVMIAAALPASAAGTVVGLLQDVSPKSSVSVPAGKTVKLRALAASGAAVTATVNGQPVTLTATDQEEDGGVWYQGTYTVPKAAGGTSLGSISFTAKSGSRTETRVGGVVNVAEKNVTVEVDPPADDNKEPVSGDMVVVKPDYAEIYSIDDRGEEYAAPYYYNLPKGTIDYVVGSTKTCYDLKSGRRIAKTNVTSLGSGTKGNNTVSSVKVKNDGTYTTLTIKQTWNVPFNLTPTPVKYEKSTSNTVTSCVPTAVILTFDYTTDFPASRISFPRNSAFKSAAWKKVTTNGIPQVQLQLELSQEGGYYGAYAKYDASGNLVLTFLNPVDSLDGARIVIDPGHGTDDPGNSGSGFYESILNLQKAQALKKELEARGAEVYMLNTNGGKRLDLYTRTDLATDWMPHVFVSVHHNWADNTSARGVEVFYNTPYSQRLAKYVCDELYEAYRDMPNGSGARNRGDKFSEFAVNRPKQFASILVEYGFLSNKDELSICVDESYNEAFAEATANGIEAFFAG